MTTTPADEGVGLRNPVRGDLPHPPDTRPHRPPSASGTEKTFTKHGRRYTYRHVGWLGHRDGAFYAIGEQPADHEPGGWSSLYLLAFVEDVIDPDPAPVLIDIRPHIAGLNCLPGDVVTLAMTIDVNITADGPVASEPAGVARRVDTSGRQGDADALFIHVHENGTGVNLTQTTGKTLAVAVNGVVAAVDDRRCTRFDLATGAVTAEPPMCDMVNNVHVEPHVGCILR